MEQNMNPKMTPEFLPKNEQVQKVLNCDLEKHDAFLDIIFKNINSISV